MTDQIPRRTADADRDPLEKADLAVVEEVARRRRHPLVRFAGMLSEIADQPQLAAVCCLTLAAGLLRGDRRLAETGLRMVSAHALATLAKSWIKNRVHRTRPHVALDEGRYEMRLGDGKNGNEKSFPSGHTAGAFAVARVAADRYPGIATPAYGLAAAISLVQVPRGKHYPTDLAAGLMIGLAAGSLVRVGFSALRRAEVASWEAR